MMFLRPRFLLLLLLALPGLVHGAVAGYRWPFQLNCQSGTQAQWISPVPIGVFQRFYVRVESQTVVQANMGTWVPVLSKNRVDYGERGNASLTAGVPLLTWEKTIPSFNARATLRVRMTADRHFQVDLTDFTSDVPLSLSSQGSIELLGTDVVAGDCNGDGELGPEDLDGFQHVLVDDYPEGLVPVNLDLDSDGQTTAVDLLQLRHYLAANLYAAFTGWELP